MAGTRQHPDPQAIQLARAAVERMDDDALVTVDALERLCRAYGLDKSGAALILRNERDRRAKARIG